VIAVKTRPSARATARSVIPTIAPKVSRALRSVSAAKNPSTITVAAIPRRITAAEAPVSERRR
jgi:hypothetical protein